MSCAMARPIVPSTGGSADRSEDSGPVQTAIASLKWYVRQLRRNETCLAASCQAAWNNHSPALRCPFQTARLTHESRHASTRRCDQCSSSGQRCSSKLSQCRMNCSSIFVPTTVSHLILPVLAVSAPWGLWYKLLSHGPSSTSHAHLLGLCSTISSTNRNSTGRSDPNPALSRRHVLDPSAALHCATGTADCLQYNRLTQMGREREAERSKARQACVGAPTLSNVACKCHMTAGLCLMTMCPQTGHPMGLSLFPGALWTGMVHHTCANCLCTCKSKLPTPKNTTYHGHRQ